MATNEENDVYESWEDLEDSGILDRKIKILQNKSTSEVPSSNGGLPVVILEDSSRQFYGPPDPKVKILKRPTNPSESNQVNGDSRPRQHKTLQQREQEYAEARLRILGEARSPEETLATITNSNSVESKLEVLATNGEENETRIASREAENIVRTPKGPDGTKGFNQQQR